MTHAPTEKPVVVGRILGPWGIKGWLQIYSYTHPREGIFDYSPWYIDGADAPLTPSDHKVSGKRLVIKLAGIDDPETAQAWANRDIAIDRGALPALEADEFYWHDLVGCEVINRQGLSLGTVKSMLSTGAHDVMEIATSDQTQACLIPFVFNVYVDQVDLDGGRILVDWPSEWLDGNA